MKRALITGITGQDGFYLAQNLLSKGYSVHGMIRKTPSFSLNPRITLHQGDLKDSAALPSLLSKILPDELYHLGAITHERSALDHPELTYKINAEAVFSLLESMKTNFPQLRLFHASSAQILDQSAKSPQNETTPFQTNSPYAKAKLEAHLKCVAYREKYGLYICNGILFNHESPRRGPLFVSKKITLGVAAIKERRLAKITLGNLSAQRDWGYAEEFVEAMWLMLQQDKPDDFVLATGTLISVRQFTTLAFQAAGIEICWTGAGLDEKGFDAKTGDLLVDVSPEFFRETEKRPRVGDASKAKEILGWEAKTDVGTLIHSMITHDLKEAACETH